MEERELVVTCSIGIAVYPDDGRDAETLIRNADAAMYHAKELGRANYQFFTEQMNQAASRRLQLESDLRRALGRDELRLHYQPIVETATGASRRTRRLRAGSIRSAASCFRRSSSSSPRRAASS